MFYLNDMKPLDPETASKIKVTPSLLSTQRRTAPTLVIPSATATAAISRSSGTRVATRPSCVPSTQWTTGRTAVSWIVQRERYPRLNHVLVFYDLTPDFGAPKSIFWLLYS